MLTPDELKVVPDPIVELYEQLEQDIIADIAKRLEKVGEITAAALWMRYVMAHRREDMATIKKRIDDTNKQSRAAMDSLFKEAVERSMAYDNVDALRAGKNIVSLAENAELMQFIEASAKKTQGELKNLTKSMAFKDGKQFKTIERFYQDTLDYAQFQVASGAFTPQQAIDIAVKKLVDSGIRVAEYESGAKIGIAIAVRRATLTGINQTTAEITLKTCSAMDCEFVETTAHAGARPDHQPWQGKVFHLFGGKDGYLDFETETGYGTGEGLCGWNCRHHFHPFFLGISKPMYSAEDLANIDPPPFEYNGKTYTHYEATQQQRRMERAIRKTKNEMVAYEAAGQTEQFTWSAVKLKMQERKYADFSKAAGLRTKSERTKVYGFGKSTSQKATQADKKHLGNVADALLSKFEKVEPRVTSALQEIAGKTGGELAGLEYRLKSKESLVRKIAADAKEKLVSYEVAGYEIKDVLRYTIVHNEGNFTQSYFTVVEELRSMGYNSFRVKNTFQDGQVYKGINTIMSDKKGNLFELQYHTPKSIEIKEGGLHELYEKQRVLDKAKDASEWERLKQEMIAISDTIPIPPDVERIK